MEQENENQPPPVKTESAPSAPSAQPDQRRHRGRRRYGRRRYYDRGNSNDNYDAAGQENSHGEGGNATGTEAELGEGVTTAEAEDGEQIQAEPEFGEGIIEISGKGFGFLRDPKRNFVQTPQD